MTGNDKESDVNVAADVPGEEDVDESKDDEYPPEDALPVEEGFRRVTFTENLD
jgi:hypothetical protein